MIIEFDPRHLEQLNEHPHHKMLSNPTVIGEALKRDAYCAYTCFSNDNRPLICAGVVPIWENRGLCWAYLDVEARKGLFAATRRILKDIDKMPFQRLEMYVVPGFLEAWRWAHMLGFELESRMVCGLPDGRDLYVFARMKRAVGRLKQCNSC